MIGKPYAGELHVRFDEGEQDFVSRRFLNGHEAGNGGYSQGPTYQAMSLFSTLPFGDLFIFLRSTRQTAPIDTALSGYTRYIPADSCAGIFPHPEAAI